MTQIATPSLGQLQQRPILEVGPYRFHIVTHCAPLATDLLHQYAEYPWLTREAMADYRIDLRAPVWWRRYIRPHLIADTDVKAPFIPVALNKALITAEMALNWSTAMTSLRHLILHAGGVALGNDSIILAGESGSGKSTLAVGLGYRGWRYLSDEFAILDPQSGLHYPYPRPASLKNNAIALLATFVPQERFSASFSNTLKGTVCYVRPPRSAITMMHTPAQPRFLIFPAFAADATTGLVPMSASEALLRLVAGSANYQTLGARGFACLTRLMQTCPAYWLHYNSFDGADSLLQSLMRSPRG